MKRVLIAVFAAGMAVLHSPCTSYAQADKPFRIGVMGDHSGANIDLSGPRSLQAVQMAVDDFGGKVLGRKIEVLSADFSGKPEIASAKVRQWFEQDDVQAVMEGPTSSAAVAMQKLAEDNNRVFLNTTGSSSDFTGKLCTQTAVQWITDTYANTAATVKALVSQGWSSVYFLTTDQTFGHSLEKDATTMLTALGGKSLGAVRHPLGTQDFSSALLQAKASKAQVLALANSGSDTENAIGQASEFGINKTMHLAPFTFFLTNVHTIGLHKAEGLVFPDSFYWDSTEETRAWNARFQAKMGVPANRTQANAYSAVLHYLRTVENLGRSEGRDVVARMKATPINDFWLKNVRIREDGRVMMDIDLYQVKAPAESKYPFDYLKLVKKIPAEEAYRPLSDGGCPLVAKN
jgi:branched-chain amino acid transport system substrate-binding protein